MKAVLVIAIALTIMIGNVYGQTNTERLLSIQSVVEDNQDGIASILSIVQGITDATKAALEPIMQMLDEQNSKLDQIIEGDISLDLTPVSSAIAEQTLAINEHTDRMDQIVMILNDTASAADLDTTMAAVEGVSERIEYMIGSIPEDRTEEILQAIPEDRTEEILQAIPEDRTEEILQAITQIQASMNVMDRKIALMEDRLDEYLQPLLVQEESIWTVPVYPIPTQYPSFDYTLTSTGSKLYTGATKTTFTTYDFQSYRTKGDSVFMDFALRCNDIVFLRSASAGILSQNIMRPDLPSPSAHVTGISIGDAVVYRSSFEISPNTWVEVNKSINLNGQAVTPPASYAGFAYIQHDQEKLNMINSASYRDNMDLFSVQVEWTTFNENTKCVLGTGTSGGVTLQSTALPKANVLIYSADVSSSNILGTFNNTMTCTGPYRITGISTGTVTPWDTSFNRYAHATTTSVVGDIANTVKLSLRSDGTVTVREGIWATTIADTAISGSIPIAKTLLVSVGYTATEGTTCSIRNQ